MKSSTLWTIATIGALGALAYVLWQKFGNASAPVAAGNVQSATIPLHRWNPPVVYGPQNPARLPPIVEVPDTVDLGPIQLDVWNPGMGELGPPVDPDTLLSPREDSGTNLQATGSMSPFQRRPLEFLNNAT